VKLGPLGLEADVTIPHEACGVVIFVHGSGSSRLSPRNRHVAAALNRHGLATILFDLLTEAEAEDRRKVFDIPLLAERLSLAIVAAGSDPRLAQLPIGLFGASTGAAAALIAAARSGNAVKAVVSRGGRPDLAAQVLDKVKAPVLLIVGGDDTPVIAMNEMALRGLDCPKRLAIVPGATHLFEEPGTLDRVVELATHWFLDHLCGRPPS